MQLFHHVCSKIVKTLDLTLVKEMCALIHINMAISWTHSQLAKYSSRGYDRCGGGVGWGQQWTFFFPVLWWEWKLKVALLALLEWPRGNNSVITALKLILHYPSCKSIFFLNFSIPLPPPKSKTFLPLITLVIWTVPSWAYRRISYWSC